MVLTTGPTQNIYLCTEDSTRGENAAEAPRTTEASNKIERNKWGKNKVVKKVQS